MIAFSLTLVVFFLLLVITLIDLKTKKVPAFLTTATLLVALMVNFQFFDVGIAHLSLGVMAFIFGYMLYELDFISGVADIKVIAIIGVMLLNFDFLFIFFILVGLIGLVYKIIWRVVMKKQRKDEAPFIFALLCIYLILWLSGGLA
jgi:Flp pilus assembly protein protease CpaA